MGNPHVFGISTTAHVTQRSSFEDRNSVSATQESRNTLNLQVNGAADYYRHSMPASARTGITQPQHAHSVHHHQLQIQQQHRQTTTNTRAQGQLRQQDRMPAQNAVTDLLPFCTAGPPLRQEQVIALSDIVGSLKELTLLALGASAGDASCADKLTGAVGRETAGDIVAFFADELEVE